MRQTIFISHATPEDNEFTRWLSLQLTGLGYIVWSDVLKLKGGEDWWPLIESEIRDNTIKFLVVLSRNSNSREGVLKELAVGQKMKDKLHDFQFIIPLHIDENFSYDDVNIELNRLNSINFKKSWADGLQKLVELFEDQFVPKSDINYNLVNELWQKISLRDKHPIEKEEVYYSNWFPVLELPKKLNFHRFNYAISKEFDVRKLPFPVVKHKNCLVSFAGCYDFTRELPKTRTYNQADTKQVETEEILNGTYDSKFISNIEAKRLIIQLLNKGFNKTLLGKEIERYKMPNKTSFWIKKGVLKKDKIDRIQLVGKQKDKNWHFAISGNVKMFPERCFVINSHIWFTSDGSELIPEASKQHSARRKQGKNWWNNDWRNKTLAFLKYLSDDHESFHLILGSEERAKISIKPIMFESPVSYIDPSKTNLPEEDQTFADEEEDEVELNDNEE